MERVNYSNIEIKIFSKTFLFSLKNWKESSSNPKVMQLPRHINLLTFKWNCLF